MFKEKEKQPKSELTKEVFEALLQKAAQPIKPKKESGPKEGKT